MRRHIWKTSVAAAAVAVLLMAGCGGEKKEQETLDETRRESHRETLEELPEIETGVNLIVNPGFEEWDGYKPVGWTTKIFTGEGKNLSFYGKSDKARSGESSFYLRGTFNTDRWVVVMQRFPVRPGHKIVFSADIMTEDIKQNRGQKDNLGVYVIFFDGDGQRVNDRYFADAWTIKRTGTNSWLRKDKETEVPDGARIVEVGVLNQMTGYAYFDEVSLVIKEKIDWESKDSKFITYNWFESRPFPPEDMKRMSGLIEEIAKEAGIKEIEGRINYFLYPDDETFMKILERSMCRTIAIWEKKELHDVKSFNDHEIIHLILYDLGFPPVGLSKGFVFYFRAKYEDWDMHIRSKRFLMQKQIPALYKTIDSKKWRMADYSVVVPAWASFVEYLIDKYGMDKFKELYAITSGIIEEEEFAKRFRDIYGFNFQEADRAWRLFIMRYEGDAAADTLPDAGETQ